MYLSARSFSNPLTGEPQPAAEPSDDEGEAGDAGLGRAQRRVSQVSCISVLHPDGSVELADGSLLPDIDTVMLCTGALTGKFRKGLPCSWFGGRGITR